jgi:hypothetical protein
MGDAESNLLVEEKFATQPAHLLQFCVTNHLDRNSTFPSWHDINTSWKKLPCRKKYILKLYKHIQLASLTIFGIMTFKLATLTFCGLNFGVRRGKFVGNVCL